MAKANLTKDANIQTQAREMDFVTRFANNWTHLLDLIGITRDIVKPAGTQLVSKYAEVALENGEVAEGGEIPYSQASVKTKDYEKIKIEKYSKGVSLEAINEHGYDDAVGLTDDQFLFELQNRVTNKFYAFVNERTLTSAKSTFQSALSEAQGRVRNQWQKMGKGITDVVGWCNMLDAYDYLGAAGITVQSEFGMNYIENFLGYKKLFLCSDNQIESGVIIATPVENIINYHVSPDDSDYAKAGLAYTTDGVTNLIGFHTQGNYGTAVSEAFALMGITVMAEYIDGVAVVNIGTESFTAVESPTGDPSAKKYYEKNAKNEYFRTTDTTVASGKTYYTRTVTAGA